MIWHHTISIINETASTTNEYGDTVYVDAAAIQSNAWVQPIAATEEEITRDTRVTRFHILVPPATVVTATSKIQWEGKTLQVLGEPLPYYNRNGVHHLEFDAVEYLG